MTVTAPFLQLDAVCTMVSDAVRGNAELALAFGVTGADVCKAVLQRKAFDAKEDGAAIYTTEMPCLAIYPKSSERAYVRGGNGMKTALGVQYLFKAPVGRDGMQPMEQVLRNLHLLWWVICDAFQAPNAVTASALVDSISADSADYVGPLDDGTCAIDGTAEMSYIRPPYFVPEAVDLQTIGGDINDTTQATHVDPLMEVTLVI